MIAILTIETFSITYLFYLANFKYEYCQLHLLVYRKSFFQQNLPMMHGNGITVIN